MRILASIALVCATTAPVSAGTYEPVASFGANPGALQMFRYKPAAPAPGAALVVFLHGCTQQAADARHVGWEQLADEYGFYIVYPQQTSDNNPVQCFNWAGEYGDPANLVRGQGENQSVASMVARMKADFDIDDGKVFAAGFSAGAAFAVVMLATWPDVFAGGAVMSGIPYRCAGTVNEAYSCQQLDGHPELQRTPAQWGDLVRAADSAWTGPARPVIFFHGSADYTVKPKATDELLEQWTNVHGVALAPDETAMVAGHERQRWHKTGALVLEAWRVASMGHAVAMGAADPEHGCAPSGTYVEDRGLCAAWRAAVFLGIVEGDEGGEDPDAGPGPGPGDPDAGAVPGAPTVTITSPGDGSVLAGGITITAAASDDAGIARVEFFIDGVIAGSDGSAPYSQFWQTSLAGEGEHDIRAVAYDLYETSAEAAIHVTVDQENGGSGGGELLDPIPCGCRGTQGAAGALVGLVAVALALRPRRRR